jgi:uncharacterized protein (DUF2141 family)
MGTLMRGFAGAMAITTAVGAWPTALAGTEVGPASVIVEPTNLRNNKGLLRCLAFRGKRGFPSDNEAAAAWAEAPIHGRTARCVFEGLEPGTWAFTFIHDEDRDGELDTNFFGVPTEGYGFSRDASGTFGPPDFADAAVLVHAGPRLLRLRARY